MADIDLIPQDYRAWLAQKAMLLRHAIAIVVINCVVVLAGVVLAYAAGNQRTKIAQLQAENAVTQQQQAELQLLNAEQAEYERRWSLLRGLRAGAEVDDIFMIVDRSIASGDLWFLDWSFRRAGVIVEGQQRGVETGYFIIVQDDDKSLRDKNLSVETHMTIHGQAKDHQALSTFVRKLFEEPDVEDVNVQKTAQTDYANGQVIEFNLAVILNSSLGKT